MNEARKRRLQAAQLQKDLDEYIKRVRQEGRDFSDQSREFDPGGMQSLMEESMESDEPAFPEHELVSGMADELRKVATPEIGGMFDASKMIVDAVLVLNKAVAVIEDLNRRLDALESAGSEQPTQPEETFSLPKLSDSYGDVPKPD